MKFALGAAAAITGASAIIYLLLRPKKRQLDPGKSPASPKQDKVNKLDDESGFLSVNSPGHRPIHNAGNTEPDDGVVKNSNIECETGVVHRISHVEKESVPKDKSEFADINPKVDSDELSQLKSEETISTNSIIELPQTYISNENSVESVCENLNARNDVQCSVLSEPVNAAHDVNIEESSNTIVSKDFNNLHANNTNTSEIPVELDFVTNGNSIESKFSGIVNIEKQNSKSPLTNDISCLIDSVEKLSLNLSDSVCDVHEKSFEINDSLKPEPNEKLVNSNVESLKIENGDISESDISTFKTLEDSSCLGSEVFPEKSEEISIDIKETAESSNEVNETPHCEASSNLLKKENAGTSSEISGTVNNAYSTSENVKTFTDTPEEEISLDKTSDFLSINSQSSIGLSEAEMQSSDTEIPGTVNNTELSFELSENENTSSEIPNAVNSTLCGSSDRVETSTSESVKTFTDTLKEEISLDKTSDFLSIGSQSSVGLSEAEMQSSDTEIPGTMNNTESSFELSENENTSSEIPNAVNSTVCGSSDHVETFTEKSNEEISLDKSIDSVSSVSETELQSTDAEKISDVPDAAFNKELKLTDITDNIPSNLGVENNSELKSNLNNTKTDKIMLTLPKEMVEKIYSEKEKEAESLLQVQDTNEGLDSVIDEDEASSGKVQESTSMDDKLETVIESSVSQKLDSSDSKSEPDLEPHIEVSCSPNKEISEKKKSYKRRERNSPGGSDDSESNSHKDKDLNISEYLSVEEDVWETSDSEQGTETSDNNFQEIKTRNKQKSYKKRERNSPGGVSLESNSPKDSKCQSSTNFGLESEVTNSPKSESNTIEAVPIKELKTCNSEKSEPSDEQRTGENTQKLETCDEENISDCKKSYKARERNSPGNSNSTSEAKEKAEENASLDVSDKDLCTGKLIDVSTDDSITSFVVADAHTTRSPRNDKSNSPNSKSSPKTSNNKSYKDRTKNSYENSTSNFENMEYKDESLPDKQNICEIEPQTLFTPSSFPVPNQEQYIFYEFEIPQMLVGRLIGKKGSFVNKIKAATDANIVVGPHKNRKFKMCSVEGTKQQVDAALDIIREYFPIDRYPELSLAQVFNRNAAPPLPQVTAVNSPAMQIELPAGVVVEVRVSAVISGNEIWVQQPLHPSYSALNRLHSCMNLNYTDGSTTPPIPAPVLEGTVCVAQVESQWLRSQVIGSMGDVVSVVLLDVGGTVSVSHSQLRQIRCDYMTLPFQACQCLLNGIQPVSDQGWDETVAAVLEELVSNTILSATVVSYTQDCVPLVNLYRRDRDEFVCLNEKLVSLGHAQWIAPVTSS